MATWHAASSQGFNLRDKESDTSPDQLEPPSRCFIVRHSTDRSLIEHYLSRRVLKISSSQQGFLFHLMTQILQQAYIATSSYNPT